MTADPRPLGPRAQARARTMERILEIGRAQLAEQGVAGLSVREVARGLGMVSSAIYRYVASRDELLTLLIVDAYAELADAVDDALAGVATQGSADGAAPRSRFLALGDAMCAWALAHPERWTLLYGTPVPDYAAPAESTNADGTRVMQAVLRIAADAADAAAQSSTDAAAPSAAGTAAPGAEGMVGPAVGELAPEVTALLERHLDEFGVDTDPSVEFAALTAWSSLVGVISAHVFGQLGADAAAIGESILHSQVRMLADLVAPR